jgi:tetratricopeptide (TPR) repeat protein
MKKWAIILVLLLGAALAQNRQFEAAKTLYAKGDFKGAVILAADIDTSEAQAFAAKANSIYATTRPETSQESLFVQSEKYARQSITLDPKNPDGYFETARAIGRLSQLRGVAAALTQGLGPQVRDNLEKALKYNPNHYTSLIAYGLWHAEIVAKGAGWLYGANPEAAITYFERGTKLAPTTILPKVEYAHGLILLDKKKYLEKAKDLLQEAIKLIPEDAADRLDLARAKRDLEALQ